MAKTHFRAIGNPKEHKGTADLPKLTEPPTGIGKHQRGGPVNYGTDVDPRAGVSGNYKTRRHYPVAQEAQLCMRSLWKKKGRSLVRCSNRRKCAECFNFDKYREEKRKAGQK